MRLELTDIDGTEHEGKFESDVPPKQGQRLMLDVILADKSIERRAYVVDDVRHELQHWTGNDGERCFASETVVSALQQDPQSGDLTDLVVQLLESSGFRRPYRPPSIQTFGVQMVKDLVKEAEKSDDQADRDPGSVQND